MASSNAFSVYQRYSKPLRAVAGQTKNRHVYSRDTDWISCRERLCDRFHIVAKQLTRRSEGRSTIVISDEYDVQDLMHALLRLFFDDVRPEE